MQHREEAPAKVAVVQINGRARWSDNRPVVERLLRAAAVEGATMVALPENLLAMPADPREFVEMSTRDTPGAVADLCALAARFRLWLVAGTLPFAVDEPGRVAARSLVIDADGAIVAHYDKIHLFDVVLDDGASYRESATFRAGETPVVVDTPVGRLGMATCFDLRFPELFRNLVERGADWFCLPSAFTRATGQAHWHVLARARAIENSAWVVAPAQVGKHADGRETYGHSLIVDPWGEVLVDCGDSPDTVATARLDYGRLADLRARFPVRDLRQLE